MIKLSRKAQYGIKALLDLCLHSKEGPVFLKDIAERENIPLKFLEQIFIALKISGLVRSKRGSQGGYQLIKAPGNIILGEVILALEGEWNLVECGEEMNCCSTLNACVVYEVWEKATKALSSVFEIISLMDLIKRYEILGQKKEEISRLKERWFKDKEFYKRGT